MFLFLLVPFIHILQFGVSHFSRIFKVYHQGSTDRPFRLVRISAYFQFPGPRFLNTMYFSVLDQPVLVRGSLVKMRSLLLAIITIYSWLHTPKRYYRRAYQRNWPEIENYLSGNDLLLMSHQISTWYVLAMSHGKWVIKSLKARTFCGMGSIDS